MYAGKPVDRALVDRGLGAYARHPLFRTVGIDRSYYSPLRPEELSAYAAQLPTDFRCVMKVFSGITSRSDPRTGRPHATFLDPVAFEELVAAPVLERFKNHAGPLVFEFAPMRPADRPDSRTFADQLDRFLSRLPPGLSYAVELRNRELLTPRYLDALKARGVAHVVNFWERMPDVGEQLSIPGLLDAAPFVVCRLLIPPGKRYDDEKRRFSPFDRIVEPNQKMRADVISLVRATMHRGKEVFVIVNNKVEGSSPLTIRALIERLAAQTA